MNIIPAIDLKDGRCVRLRQGDMTQETVYADDVAGMARRWQDLGAPCLHVVDLNGAVQGMPRNSKQVQEILDAVSISVQVGGGIRDMQTVREYFSLGIARVVLGTAALENPSLLEEACQEFPDRIMLGVDARDGMVAVRGWTSVSDTRVADLLVAWNRQALHAVIYTDIARDGMLQGPNLAALQEVLAQSPCRVIASGGIARIEDIVALKAMGAKLEGVIVGKALYDGHLDFSAALEAAA